MIGGKSPTARQKKFHEFLASKGCAISGDPGNIHHAVGSSAKHKKTWIGQDFVICLAPRYHQYGEFSRHGNPRMFAQMLDCETALEAEKKLFLAGAIEYGLDSQLIDIIMDYHK